MFLIVFLVRSFIFLTSGRVSRTVGRGGGSKGAEFAEFFRVGRYTFFTYKKRIYKKIVLYCSNS